MCTRTICCCCWSIASLWHAYRPANDMAGRFRDAADWWPRATWARAKLASDLRTGPVTLVNKGWGQERQAACRMPTRHAGLPLALRARGLALTFVCCKFLSTLATSYLRVRPRRLEACGWHECSWFASCAHICCVRPNCADSTALCECMAGMVLH